MRAVDLIGYACGAGASKDGCKDAAAYLQQAEIEKLLLSYYIDAKWSAISNADELFGQTHPNKEDIILKHCNDIATAVKESLNQQHLPVIFGGDHSMAIGTWSGVTHALAAEGNMGLMWIDAHMDAHTPATSETGNLHGMPVATLLGRGKPSFSTLLSDHPKLDANHLVLIGIRSYEKGEHDLLREMGATIYYMDDIKLRGFNAIYQEALAIVTSASHGFGLSFDIDAFDATLVPGTGTKEYEGLRRHEVLPVMCNIASHPKLKAIEIAEYNPHLDVDNQTLRLIETMLKSFFGLTLE